MMIDKAKEAAKFFIFSVNIADEHLEADATKKIVLTNLLLLVTELAKCA